MSKRRHRTTVVTIMPGGATVSYRFDAKENKNPLNPFRIIEDAKGDGAAAVIMFPSMPKEDRDQIVVLTDLHQTPGTILATATYHPRRISAQVIQAVRTVYGNGG